MDLLCSHAMTPSPETLSLRFLEHKVGCVFRSLALGYGKPQRMKVQTMEQQFSLTEKNGCRHEVERVDQASSQILPHCRDAASDLDVFAAGSLLRKDQRLLDSARHKVERGAPFHYQRFTFVVREDEGRCVVRRIVSPPAFP